MKWGDELCGEIVTPCAGWIVSSGGDWRELRDEPDWAMQNDQPGWEHTLPWPMMPGDDPIEPIFPPKGFAGKTDVELCRAVFGSDSYAEIARDVTLYTFDMDIKNSTAAQILFVPKLKVNVSTWTRTLEETAALILALQNAQVLAARLQEPA